MPGTCRVRLTRYYEATPREVWAALTSRGSLTRWLVPVDDLDLDTMGGGFELRRDGGVALRAKVRAVERERLLELDWCVPGEASSVVRFELEPHDGGTVLALDHSLIDARSGMRAMGLWQAHLRRLDSLLDAEAAR